MDKFASHAAAPAPAEEKDAAPVAAPQSSYKDISRALTQFNAALAKNNFQRMSASIFNAKKHLDQMPDDALRPEQQRNITLASQQYFDACRQHVKHTQGPPSLLQPLHLLECACDVLTDIEDRIDKTWLADALDWLNQHITQHETFLTTYTRKKSDDYHRAHTQLLFLRVRWEMRSMMASPYGTYENLLTYSDKLHTALLNTKKIKHPDPNDLDMTRKIKSSLEVILKMIVMAQSQPDADNEPEALPIDAAYSAFHTALNEQQDDITLQHHLSNFLTAIEYLPPQNLFRDTYQPLLDEGCAAYFQLHSKRLADAKHAEQITPGHFSAALEPYIFWSMFIQRASVNCQKIQWISPVMDWLTEEFNTINQTISGYNGAWDDDYYRARSQLAFNAAYYSLWSSAGEVEEEHLLNHLSSLAHAQVWLEQIKEHTDADETAQKNIEVVQIHVAEKLLPEQLRPAPDQSGILEQKWVDLSGAVPTENKLATAIPRFYEAYLQGSTAVMIESVRTAKKQYHKASAAQKKEIRNICKTCCHTYMDLTEQLPKRNAKSALAALHHCLNLLYAMRGMERKEGEWIVGIATRLKNLIVKLARKRGTPDEMLRIRIRCNYLLARLHILEIAHRQDPIKEYSSVLKSLNERVEDMNQLWARRTFHDLMFLVLSKDGYANLSIETLCSNNREQTAPKKEPAAAKISDKQKQDNELEKAKEFEKTAFELEQKKEYGGALKHYELAREIHDHRPQKDKKKLKALAKKIAQMTAHLFEPEKKKKKGKKKKDKKQGGKAHHTPLPPQKNATEKVPVTASPAAAAAAYPTVTDDTGFQRVSRKKGKKQSAKPLNTPPQPTQKTAEKAPPIITPPAAAPMSYASVAAAAAKPAVREERKQQPPKQPANALMDEGKIEEKKQRTPEKPTASLPNKGKSEENKKRAQEEKKQERKKPLDPRLNANTPAFTPKLSAAAEQPQPPAPAAAPPQIYNNGTLFVVTPAAYAEQYALWCFEEQARRFTQQPSQAGH